MKDHKIHDTLYQNNSFSITLEFLINSFQSTSTINTFIAAVVGYFIIYYINNLY